MFNSNSVIYGKGIILQDLGVHKGTVNYYYTKPKSPNIKEYFVIQ